MCIFESTICFSICSLSDSLFGCKILGSDNEDIFGSDFLSKQHFLIKQFDFVSLIFLALFPFSIEFVTYGSLKNHQQHSS